MRHASCDCNVTPLKQVELRRQGLYWRKEDPLASTEFTYTRFLTPTLAGDRGLAIYFDCDFLWLADIGELVSEIDPNVAVSVVKHRHEPPEREKMGGKTQTLYPRKNWSSLMVFNLGHAKVKSLTPDVVNDRSPRYLHRFEWLDDDDIGGLNAEWNWLEGWYDEVEPQLTPKAIHFTRGGPWIAGCENVGHADLWNEAAKQASDQ